MLALLDGVLCVLRTGCAWRHQTRDFPPRQTLRWFLRLVRLELVQPKPGQRGFAVQPRHWVIEHIFAWRGRCRRLARDHEATPSSAVTFFVLVAATVLLRRLAKP
jgi:transposase